MSKPKSFYRHMNRQKADEIRAMYFSRKHKQHEIAAIYGISQNTVSRIVSDLVWTAPQDRKRGRTSGESRQSA
jgi:DNA-binding transcriptional regulator LsrR (DeoR family)